VASGPNGGAGLAGWPPGLAEALGDGDCPGAREAVVVAGVRKMGI
jgi:hypothetical protein